MAPYRWLAAALALASAGCAAVHGAATPAALEAASARASGPVVWSFDEMVRAGPTAPPVRSSGVRLDAARAETTAFEVAVRAPAGGLAGVTLTASPLRDAAGRRASASFVLYREYFVNVAHASAVYGRPASLGAGIYPDGLIPFVDPQTGKPPRKGRLRAQPVSIAAGTTQPYWIDVAVARDAAPGDYSGAITVRTDRGSARVPVALHVWRFAMPVAASLGSDFGIDSYDGANVANAATAQELLRERVQPNPVPLASERRLEAFGLKMVSIPLWSGAYYGHCTMSPPPPEPAVRKLVAQNAIANVYAQVADEIEECPNLQSTLVPIMRRYARELHAAGALNLLTTAPIRSLENDGTGRSAVDIWAMLPPEYDGNVRAVDAAIAAGYAGWYYTALGQDDYSPKWEIDVPPADYRIPSLIDESLGLTGELYWSVDYWSKTPWDDVEYAAGSGEYFAGEGILAYPGSDAGVAGVVPSMRLKWIRDGMFDADEVALLRACGRGAWALRRIASVAANWHEWSESPAAIEAVHRTLAEALDANCAR